MAFIALVLWQGRDAKYEVLTRKVTEREKYVIHIYRGNDLLNSLGRVNLWLPQILSAIIELYHAPLHYPFLLPGS